MSKLDQVWALRYKGIEYNLPFFGKEMTTQAIACVDVIKKWPRPSLVFTVAVTRRQVGRADIDVDCSEIPELFTLMTITTVVKPQMKVSKGEA